MKFVLDASVIIKWLLADPQREATVLLDLVINGVHDAIQPVHWLAEVGGFLARATPDTAEKDIAMLVTADMRYLRAARRKGKILSLTEWQRGGT